MTSERDGVLVDDAGRIRTLVLNRPFSASSTSSADLTLLQAWLDAAGEELNYGTLQSAVDAGFELTVPGDPAVRTNGPPPDADGDPPAYLFEWDPSAEDHVLVED